MEKQLELRSIWGIELSEHKQKVNGVYIGESMLSHQRIGIFYAMIDEQPSVIKTNLGNIPEPKGGRIKLIEYEINSSSRLAREVLQQHGLI